MEAYKELAVVRRRLSILKVGAELGPSGMKNRMLMSLRNAKWSTLFAEMVGDVVCWQSLPIHDISLDSRHKRPH